MSKYKCPCCGYFTLSSESRDSYEICEVCFWEDDPVQFEDENYSGGANLPSLKVARENYIKYGAMEKRFVKMYHLTI
jgi:hypothetical protein